MRSFHLLKFPFLISTFLLTNLAFGQKSEFFKNINFDSSYSVIGIGPHWSNASDSLQRFCFILDNLKDLSKLKEEWVFKKEVEQPKFEENCFLIFLTKDKRLLPGGLIYLISGSIKTNDGWYRFDTSQLQKLHYEKPLKYHTQTDTFKIYSKFARFYNTVINQPSFLFLFEPNIKYEGKFFITVNKTADPASPIFALNDLNKELALLAPKNSFCSYLVTNDTFNLANKKEVRITVESSRLLYDTYNSKGNKKSEWKEAIIETKSFWRD